MSSSRSARPASPSSRSNREVLFPGAPVVFIAAPSHQRPPNSTGVFMGLDLGGTIALAQRLQPDAAAGLRRQRRVGERQVSTRASRARSSTRSRRTWSSPTSPACEWRTSSGALAALPSRSLVYYLRSRRTAPDGTSSRPKARPRRCRRERAGVQLHGNLDGSRHRRRQPAQPDAARPIRRRSRAARVAGRACRRHRPLRNRSERQPGRLAPASTVGNQREPRSGRDQHPLSRAGYLGPLQVLHRRRDDVAARANVPHRRPAPSAPETTTSRGRPPEGRSRAPHQLRRGYGTLRDVSSPHRKWSACASRANCTTTWASSWRCSRSSSTSWATRFGTPIPASWPARAKHRIERLKSPRACTTCRISCTRRNSS